MGNLDLIGSAEVCDMLGGIERSTLIRRVARGELKAYDKLPGLSGPWLFDRDEVLRHKAEVEKAKAS